jgi:hypothetical protein
LILFTAFFRRALFSLCPLGVLDLFQTLVDMLSGSGPQREGAGAKNAWYMGLTLDRKGKKINRQSPRGPDSMCASSAICEPACLVRESDLRSPLQKIAQLQCFNARPKAAFVLMTQRT